MKGRGEKRNKEKPKKSRKATRKTQGINERRRAGEGSEERGTRRNHGTNHDERQGAPQGRGGRGELGAVRNHGTGHDERNGPLKKQKTCAVKTRNSAFVIWRSRETCVLTRAKLRKSVAPRKYSRSEQNTAKTGPRTQGEGRPEKE